MMTPEEFRDLEHDEPNQELIDGRADARRDAQEDAQGEVRDWWPRWAAKIEKPPADDSRLF
jgi:hypothetical protein